MSMRTVELVSEWDTVPFDGGYEGLRTLSDQGFSGAVTAGSTQLFMLNGTAVGIIDGDIDAFEDASGTARAAPHDALPLLVVMQDRADQPRAQYYTEDTPIADVDQTLEDGNFTGFVELSENVLSGDYYLVYHQGRSMSVAWVGNSQRLITDDEAFDQADGEVGIYQVMPADIEPIALPEPPEPEPSEAEQIDTDGFSVSGAEIAESDHGAQDADEQSAEESPASGEDGQTGAASRTGEADTEQATGASERDTGSAPSAEASERDTGSAPSAEASERDTGSAPSAEASERDTGSAPSAESDSEERSQAAGVERDRRVERQDSASSASTDSAETDDAEAASERRANTSGSESAGVGATEAAAAAAEASSPTTDSAQSGGAKPETDDQAASSDPTATAPDGSETAPTDDPAPTAVDREREAHPEQSGDTQPAATPTDATGAEALETRSIPSLDPERSSSTPDESVTTTTASTAPTSPSASTNSQSAASTDSSSTTDSQSTGTEPSSATSSKQGGGQSAATVELEAKLEERATEVTELEAEIDELSTENDALATERDRLASELEDARAEIQRLEQQVEAAGGVPSGGRELSAAEAIDGTNLFLRYHSKGEATLAKAQKGNAARASVNENLRLEHHTQFDGDDAVVDGTAFDEFLRDSIQYRFVDWLVSDLLYEIRDTGHESGMGVLYEALPEIDRAELNGNVSVTYTEDGQEHRSQEQFDVVVRDRMGNPLVVANINNSRQPATDGQMTNLVRDAERVGDASDSLSAAFLVTSSFFEPEALETAKEATSSGLFSRDKRKSFVNLSRKGGYHLCLLEARNKEFHLAVPEL